MLQAAIPGSQLAEMAWGGHACNVTDTATFNPILCDGLAAMLPSPGEPMSEAISPAACAALFTEARTHNGWLGRPVSDEQLREIYALLKMGPDLR